MIVYTERHGAATKVAIADVCSQLGVSSDSWIVDFWEGSDGALLNDQVLIYATREIKDRNSVFEIDSNFKGMIAVGDDSGGRVILANKEGGGCIYLVDVGSISLEEAERFESLEELLGFIVSEDDSAEAEIGDVVTVGSVKPSLEEIIGLNKVLGLELSVIDLKMALSKRGEVLLSSVYVQKYKGALKKYPHIINFKFKF